MMSQNQLPQPIPYQPVEQPEPSNSQPVTPATL